MNILQLQSDPAAFRDALLIDSDRGPVPFREVIDSWQSADFAALDNGWKRCIGQDVSFACSRAWLERPRGHSKTLDLAIMSAWALFAARKPLSGIAAAADLDQARLLRDAIGKLVYCNPWLSSILEVQNYRVVNVHTQSTLDIISSDAPTSYGLTPDFVIADEVTHWRKRDLWDSLISSAAKRSTCIFVCITNAGLQDDWTWKVREAIRNDAAWLFSRLDGPKASWITQDRLAEQERLLPSIAFSRLWMNSWSSGGGDALAPELIDVAFRPELHRHIDRVAGFEYVGGLDLGVSRDASAICVLGVRRAHAQHGRIRLAYTRLWKPTKGKRVDLLDVEKTLFELHSRFDLKQLNYDPWQATHLASTLQASGVGRIGKKGQLPMVEITMTGQNLQRIASAVLEAFNDKRVELYSDADLRYDLEHLRVEERSYGFRLTSPRDDRGHGDLGTAFSLALIAAVELAAKRRVVVGAYGLDNLGSTPMDCLKNFYQRQREFDDEQRMLNTPDSDSEPLQRVMARFGRCNFPTY